MSHIFPIFHQCQVMEDAFKVIQRNNQCIVLSLKILIHVYLQDNTFNGVAVVDVPFLGRDRGVERLFLPFLLHK